MLLRRLFEGKVDPWALTLALAATLVVGWLAAPFARRGTVAALRAVMRDTVSTATPQVRRLL